MESKSYTIAILKPDISHNQEILGEVFKMILDAGFSFAGKKHRLTSDEVDRLYSEHVGRDYYEGHRAFMESRDSILMVLEHPSQEAIGLWRAMVLEIRSRHASDKTRNAAHGSDSPEAAARELEVVEVLFGEYSGAP